jgi:hypothetical protein
MFRRFRIFEWQFPTSDGLHNRTGVWTARFAPVWCQLYLRRFIATPCQNGPVEHKVNSTFMHSLLNFATLLNESHPG